MADDLFYTNMIGILILDTSKTKRTSVKNDTK